jgi:hypothetical protein
MDCVASMLFIQPLPLWKEESSPIYVFSFYRRDMFSEVLWCFCKSGGFLSVMQYIWMWLLCSSGMFVCDCVNQLLCGFNG